MSNLLSQCLKYYIFGLKIIIVIILFEVRECPAPENAVIIITNNVLGQKWPPGIQRVNYKETFPINNRSKHSYTIIEYWLFSQLQKLHGRRWNNTLLPTYVSFFSNPLSTISTLKLLFPSIIKFICHSENVIYFYYKHFEKGIHSNIHEIP